MLHLLPRCATLRLRLFPDEKNSERLSSIARIPDLGGLQSVSRGRGIVLIDVWKNNWEVWGRNVKWNVGLLLCCSNMEYEEFWRKFILISDIFEDFGRNVRVEKCLRKKKFLIWERIYERIIISFERNIWFEVFEESLEEITDICNNLGEIYEWRNLWRWGNLKRNVSGMKKF